MNRRAKHSLTLGVSDWCLGALACVVICKAREHDYEYSGDYRGGQICLRGVILEIGEQSSARDENLRQSADDGAGY